MHEAILAVSHCIRRVKINEVAGARAGDLVYLDPPYTVAHGKNGFVHYNANLFSWDDQERLARCAVRLADRGCHVLVSNADHDSIRNLYKTFTVAIIERSSTMAASRQYRQSI